MARCLVAAGARVVLVGRRLASSNACHELGPAASPLRGDVTQLETAAALVEAPRAVGPDVLVNNAGVHEETGARHDGRGAATVLQTCPSVCADARGRAALRGAEGGSVLSIASMTCSSACHRWPTPPPRVPTSDSCGPWRSSGTVWRAGQRDRPRLIASPMLERALSGDPVRKGKILGRTPLAVSHPTTSAGPPSISPHRPRSSSMAWCSRWTEERHRFRHAAAGAAQAKSS
jgi:gluconate 5-dehydrogenase